MDEKLTYQIYEEFQKQYNNTATEKHLSPMTWLPSATKKTVDQMIPQEIFVPISIGKFY